MSTSPTGLLGKAQHAPGGDPPPTPKHPPTLSKLALLATLLLLLTLTSSAPAQAPQENPNSPPIMAPVPVPQPTAKAMSFYRSGNWLWALGQTLTIGVPAFLLATGLSTRIARRCETLSRQRWYLAVPLFTASYLILDALITLPYSYYVGYVRAHAYGLSRQSLGRWLELWSKGLAVNLVLSAAAATGVYLALRYSPRRWWLWAGLSTLPLTLSLAVIQPLVLDPLFNRYEPLKDKAFESRIRQVASQAGLGDSRILQVDKSRDTKAMNAFVNGWLGTRQIVVWDTMLDQLENDEVLAILGHEMGHYKLDHVLRGIVVASAIILVGLFIIHVSCKYILKHYGSRLGVGRLSDTASLPLLLAVGNLVALLLLPLGYAHSRYMEREADRFGLELTQLNHASATSFAKFLDTNLSNPNPGQMYNLWRATHPSLSERITFCNEYQPWNQGLPLVYDHLIENPSRQPNQAATASPGSSAVAGPLDASAVAQ